MDAAVRTGLPKLCYTSHSRVTSTPEGLGDQACHMCTCGKAHNARGARVEAMHSKETLLLLFLRLGCCWV
jgi:hypothetical protein